MPDPLPRPTIPERPGVEAVPETRSEAGVERAPDQQVEHPAVEERPAAESAPAAIQAQAAPAAPPLKSETLVSVETILQDNLAQIYRELPVNLQPEFKRRGEAVAGRIEQMIRQAKVKAKAVLELILDWLKMLPGVNRLFLEQEAKIKTDRVIALAKGIEEGKRQERHQ